MVGLPWDDDIDIGMARKDYNRFLEVAPRELGDSYFLSWIETDPVSYTHLDVYKRQDIPFAAINAMAIVKFSIRRHMMM